PFDAAGTKISVTTPVIGYVWVLPQSSVPPIPMLRGVCIALTASCNDGTRGIWSSPALLLAPSAYSQKVMGAPGPSSLWINSLGWTSAFPDWSEITAAPYEILHSAWAAEQENRKSPPVVVPTGEPRATENVA